MSALDVSHATIVAPGGRLLFDDLSLSLAREHVALVGRNGVGKSTLLAVLAGEADVQKGRVRVPGRMHFVQQDLRVTDARVETLSRGEQRRFALAAAAASGAEVLLLDEPTEDLDDAAVSWLRGWLRPWPGCLVVATHDRRLLADFGHFLVASESGCRCFSGPLEALDAELDRDHEEAQRRYVQNLHRLAATEARAEHVARRKARKKRYGRCSELDRGTPRVRLNQKRSDAQVSHGRLAKVREARLDALRQWSRSTRRALGVTLGLDLPPPSLAAPAGDVLVLRDVSAHAGGRFLFSSLHLRLGRRRLAVVGPNGAGKTTLLGIMLGRTAPATGSASRDLSKIGVIEQGATDWMLEETLISCLRLAAAPDASSDPAKILVAHRFPLALAERPLRSLSPGERTRAALLCLFRRAPPVELLVLDEPTYSLDLVGQRAMTSALRDWPGGLVVASHDRAFLAAIGAEVFVDLTPGAPGTSDARKKP